MTHFSISVPIGAWHPLLPACLESLKRQAADCSVAFLDASGDRRVHALADQHDDWLAYRRHGPDRGQSDAILEGWANTKGDVLGWLNADDLLMPDALAQAVAAFADNLALDVVYGHSTILDETGAMTGYHFAVEPPGDRLLEAGTISQPSCFFKRAAYDGVGGLDRDRHYTMDWDLWIRLYRAGAQFGFIEAPLSQVMWGKDTKTASLNRARRDELKALIRQHTPPERQKAVFRAFMIHGAVDRIQPEGVRTRVVRRLRKAGPVLFGLGSDGRLHGQTALHLAHYDIGAKRGLAIELDGRADLVALSADRGGEAGMDGGELRYTFNEPLQSGETAIVTLNADSPDDARFVRARWID